MGSVFISHSWSDKPIARKIAETLRKFAISVWLDEAEIKLGDSLIEKIRAGIDSVDYVVAFPSKDAVASEWVKKELDIAMNQEIEGKRVKVLPVLAGQYELPGFLKGKLYADMSTPKQFKAAIPCSFGYDEYATLAVVQPWAVLRLGGIREDAATTRSHPDPYHPASPPPYISSPISRPVVRRLRLLCASHPTPRQ